MNGPSFRFRAALATDVGRVRTVNQDRGHVMADDGLFIVADGMGGHRAGEVAAEIAVTQIAREWSAGTPLDELIRAANREIFARQRGDVNLAGMGTTVTALAALPVEDGEDPVVSVANVGDSRTYLLRAGELHQLTDDHSIVGEMVRAGQLTHDQARVHRQRSILTRALGVEPSVEVDMFEVLPASGDRFVLCSDGLYGEVPDAAIAAALRRLDDPDEAARELVRLAVSRGGSDNITVAVIDVLDGPGLDPARRASQAVEATAEPTAEPTPAAAAPAAAASPAVARAASGEARPDQPAPRPTAPPARELHPPRRGPRLVSLRTLLFLVLLGVVVGVVVWAMTNDPGGTPAPATTTTVASTTTTVASTTTVATTTTIAPATITIPVTVAATGASPQPRTGAPTARPETTTPTTPPTLSLGPSTSAPIDAITAPVTPSTRP